MRTFFIGLCVLLLAGCAVNRTVNNNPGGANGKLSQWQGQSISAVIKRLGAANQVLQARNGNTYYVYTTSNYQNYPSSRPSPAYATATYGYAQLPVQETAYANYSVVKCSLIFEVDANKMIISTATKGYDCDSTLAYLNK